MTNGAWNLRVEPIRLTSLAIDASQRLGIVIAQPYYKLVPDGAIAFRIADGDRDSQMTSLERAFAIRTFEASERPEPVPFVIFPELSIPVGNPDGLGTVREQMMNIDGEAIFIGGLEGLSPEEASNIADKFSPPQNIARPLFGAGSYVNMCVIAVKFGDGSLEWHFQAKIRPSQWEQPKNMACGQRLLLFQGNRATFLCQICFDHFAAQGENRLNLEIIRQITATTEPNVASLDFVFVSQYNEKPNHATARNNTSNLLNYSGRLKNDTTTIVFANRAACEQGGTKYGRSGCYYRSDRWKAPTEVGPRGYQLYDSDGMTLAVFRKRTAAIHASSLVPPSENVGIAGNPRLPFESPRSYLVDISCESPDCSCLPGTECDGGRYVECDCLPCRLRDVARHDLATTDIRNRWHGADAETSERLADHYSVIRQSLLSLNEGRSKEIVGLLLCKHNGEKNPDKWELEATQFEAVVEMLSVLSTIAEWKAVSLHTDAFWTATLDEAVRLVLLDGDHRYSWNQLVEGYNSEFSDCYYSASSRTKPILFVTIRSGGQVLPPVKDFEHDITKPSDRRILGDEESFTRASTARFFVCQASLVEEARQNASIEAFINDHLGVILG